MPFDLNDLDHYSQGGRTQNFLSEINMTPFVDVCLVLLIIFMVTAPFAVSGINVHLPKTEAKPLSLTNDSLILSITQKGTFHLGKFSVKEEELTAKIKAISENEEHPAIFIRADENVPYGKVMTAMAAAQKAGIEKIGMIGENKRKK